MCVSERESKAFQKELDIKTKLHVHVHTCMYMYMGFVKQSEFKKYSHGFCDLWTSLDQI